MHHDSRSIPPAGAARGTDLVSCSPPVKRWGRRQLRGKMPQKQLHLDEGLHLPEGLRKG